MIDKLSEAYGRFISSLALFGCLLLLAMMLIIVTDVALRNFAFSGGPQGLGWSNEVSEFLLYLITLSVAPWLLRQGQHIRVDILLQAIPKKLAWTLEWMGDLLGLVCCLVMSLYGTQATWASYSSNSLNIKTLVTPEWWSLAPLPVVFALLSIEMIFRMRRLWLAERGPRSDAVSAA
jgi:TRAP-type C4-dicarboxylate transport system permease small subunit